MTVTIGRRELLAALGGAAAVWPFAASAQQPTKPVIGVLRSTTAAGSEHFVAAFREGLKEIGYIEGENVAVEYRWGNDQLERLPSLAAELVERRPAVIATIGDISSALAAKAATTTIPIVFSVGSDPVQRGLVASLNRPSGNITGVTSIALGVEAKRLSLLHELVPAVRAYALLVNSRNSNAESETKEVLAAAGTLGLHLYVLNASSGPEFEAAFATIVERRVGALLMGVDPIFTANRNRLVMLAAHHRIPTSYQDRDFVLAGGLLSYGANMPDTIRRAALYVGRILKGDKPADLPVLQPTKIELVLNSTTARALDLQIPDRLLALADEVIE
jgi:putative ABC transport system substrate-binding protein